MPRVYKDTFFKVTYRLPGWPRRRANGVKVFKSENAMKKWIGRQVEGTTIVSTMSGWVIWDETES